MPKQLMRMYLFFIIVFSFIGFSMFFDVNGDSGSPKMTTTVIGDTKKSADNNINIINSEVGKKDKQKKQLTSKQSVVNKKDSCDTNKVVQETINYVKLKGFPVSQEKKKKICNYVSIIDSEKKRIGFNVETEWIVAMMFQESKLNPQTVSSHGAKGLMQFMPRTWNSFCMKRIPNTYSSHIYDEEKNIKCGVIYLKYLYDKFGKNIKNAIIAYNCGEGNFQRKKYSMGKKSHIGLVSSHYHGIK